MIKHLDLGIAIPMRWDRKSQSFVMDRRLYSKMSSQRIRLYGKIRSYSALADSFRLDILDITYFRPKDSPRDNVLYMGLNEKITGEGCKVGYN